MILHQLVMKSRGFKILTFNGLCLLFWPFWSKASNNFHRILLNLNHCDLAIVDIS